MAVNTNADVLVERIRLRLNKFKPNSLEMTQGLTLIGNFIRNLAITNVRKHGMIDTGALINSIRYEMKENNTIEIGSFGIVYAAINEFGGPVTDQMRRAMFANLRARGKLKKDYASKNVMTASKWRERPYLRPAVQGSKTYILRVLKEMFRE